MIIKKTNLFSILIIFVMIGISFNFNNSVIKIRLSEADYHLYKVALNQFVGNTFIITSKYNIIKKQITSRNHLNEQYGLEGQIQAILSKDQSDWPKTSYKPLPKYHPVALSLRFLRSLLGKDQLILPGNTVDLNKDLEISYFLERNRHYERALENYNKLLSEQQLSSQLFTSILLHKAFCISMLGNLDESVSIYREINTKYPETEAGILAGKMIIFLNDIIGKNQMLATSSKSDLFIGRQLYLNMNYKKAIQHLDNEVNNPKNSSEAYYYKGRAHEELGQYKKAIYSYHKIMNLGRDTRWSKASNRRLVMLGDIYKQKHPLQEIAEENLKTLKDTQFLNDIINISELITVSENENSLRNKYLSKETIEEDSGLNFIDIKKDAITESIKPQEKKEERKKNRQRIIRKKKRVLTEAEKIEMKRKLATSKYRKASFIRKSIETNTSKLQKIYLNHINAGIEIHGEMIVEMDILSSGRINASIKRSNISNSQFKQEIIKEISRWRFPELDEDLGTLTISYPFNFK